MTLRNFSIDIPGCHTMRPGLRILIMLSKPQRSRDGAPNTLICAALLHDIGFMILIHKGVRLSPLVDNKHEEVAARWLSKFFGTDVTEPIRLHVQAKRFLATEPGYLSKLDDASNASLGLQGGLMNDSEINVFMNHRYFDDAIQLRRWDDRAKVPGAKTVTWPFFYALLPEIATSSL